jgi:hypothetical protein
VCVCVSHSFFLCLTRSLPLSPCPTFCISFAFSTVSGVLTCGVAQEVSDSDPASFTILFESATASSSGAVYSFQPEVSRHTHAPSPCRCRRAAVPVCLCHLVAMHVGLCACGTVRAFASTRVCADAVAWQVWDLYCGRATQRAHLLRMLARVWQSTFQRDLYVNHVR